MILSNTSSYTLIHNQYLFYDIKNIWNIKDDDIITNNNNLKKYYY